jgi:FkbH-like protein
MNPREQMNEATPFKCVVWDLDNTLWEGVLLEDEQVRLKPQVPQIVRSLDQRGILQSIASKNAFEPAMAKLREFGLAEYFLYPQISWNSKAASIEKIAASLNIGLDAVGFVDDQPFEREEVAFALPVRCLDPEPLDRLLDLPEMYPRFITDDSRLRRRMYLQDQGRKEASDEYTGPAEDFLRTLDMVFEIAPAREHDLQRVEELTVRTHQLNTTGYTYSYEELDAFRTSPRHELLIASLTDRFGSYGKIGLALVERGERVWTVKLLLMSCRVMSRGVGTILLGHVMRLAQDAGVPLRAEFKANGRNRMMYVTYRFAQFEEVARADDVIVLQHDCRHVPAWPDYVTVQRPEHARRAAAAVSHASAHARPTFPSHERSSSMPCAATEVS